LFVLLLGLALLWFWGVHRFFAITRPVPTDLLAVEGWVADYGMRVASQEFASKGYRRVFTTGGPVEGMGGYVNDYSTAANIGAAKLRHAGVPVDAVQPVPSRVFARDRTYSAALALSEWLKIHHPQTTAINVMTADLHARRTLLLFQMALGPRVKVGVIAIPSPDYDADRWWRSSEGVRGVLGETIAYVYAKVFFWP